MPRSGVPTVPPVTRELDYGALVRNSWGDEWLKHEKVYEFGKRTFESDDYGREGLYQPKSALVLAGTALGGSAHTILLGTDANGGAPDYVGRSITTTDFATTTLTSRIVGYTEPTRDARVVPPWGANFTLHTGTAQAGTNTSLTLGTGANFALSGTLSLTTGAGAPQSRDILSYNEATFVAIVSKWDAPYLSGTGTSDDGTQATFYLDFPDLGSGAVDTTPTFGTVSATFTRATTATTVLSNGLIASVASGVARSYYDPTTLTYLGYLAEGARTNLCLSSEDLRSAAAGNPVTEWANTDTTVTVAGTTAPDGSANGNLLTEGTAGTATATYSVTATADAPYAIARWFKYGNSPWVRVNVSDGTNLFRVWIDVQNGVVGTLDASGVGASGTSAALTAYPNGWYRLALVGVVGNGATAISVQTASALADGNSTRVNNATRYEWGSQFENNVSFASSYIPTTTAAVTRNADLLTYPTTGWLNASAGTLFSQATAGGATLTAAGIAFTLDDGTANNRISLQRGTISDPGLAIVNGGVLQAQLDLGTWSDSLTGKIVGAYAANDAAGSFNGGAVGTDTSVSLPTVTTAVVGALAGANQFFGPIRRVAYFPVRLQNATLQSITGSPGLTFAPATFPVSLPGPTTLYEVESTGPGLNTLYSISAS